MQTEGKGEGEGVVEESAHPRRGESPPTMNRAERRRRARWIVAEIRHARQHGHPKESKENDEPRKEPKVQRTGKYRYGRAR